MKRSQTGNPPGGHDEDQNIAVTNIFAKRSKISSDNFPISGNNQAPLQSIFSTNSLTDLLPTTFVHAESNTESPGLQSALLPGNELSPREIPDFLHYSSDEDNYDSGNGHPNIDDVKSASGNPVTFDSMLKEPQQYGSFAIANPTLCQELSIVKPPDAIRSPMPVSKRLASSPSQISPLVKLSSFVPRRSSPVQARCLTQAEIAQLQSKGGAAALIPGVIASPQVVTLSTGTAAISFPDDRQEDKNLADPRKFVCGSCSAKFTRRANLNRHQLVHTRDRPFKCPLCAQVFSLSGNLKRHLSNVHKTELMLPSTNLKN